MQQKSTRLFKLSTLSLALALAACGGGGDSSSSAPVTASRTVSGTAAKGIIKGGTVNVYAVNADGSKGTTAVVTGTTGADGTFSVKVPADLLSFVVVVSGGPGAVTVDEATGQDVAIDATFKLRNVVKLASAGETTYTGSVSPLTEMITKTAESATGGLSAANIASAKAGFAAFFGFDPEQVKPVNSNNAAAAGASADEKKQSVMLAAISQMAKDGSLDCALPTPAEKITCVVGKVAALGTISSGGMTVNDTLSGAIDSAATTVVSDPTINRTGTTNVAQLPKGTVPVVAPAATPVAAATRLFTSLRNNIAALNTADDKGSIDIRADAMRADFDKATAPLDPDLGKWIQLTTRGIDYLRAYQANGGANTMAMYAGATRIGGCGIYSDADGKIAATSKADAVSVGCSIVRKNVPNSFSVVNGHNTFKQVTAAFTLNPVSGSSYTYVGRARIETLVDGVRDPSKDVTVGTYGNEQKRATGTIDYVRTGNIVDSIAFKGTMPARTDDFGTAVTDRETWDVTASRTSEGNNLFKYTLSGTIASIKADQEVGKVSIADGSFLRTEEKVAGDIVASGVKEFSLGLAAEAGGSKVAGKLVMTEAMADKNGFNYQPTKIAFTGSLSTNSAEFFTGTLAFTQTGYNLFDSMQPVSATNVEKQNASLVGKLSITDRPALIIQLNAGRIRAASETLSLTGQYNDGTNLVNFSVSDGSPRVTKISSVDGVSLTLTGAESVDVLKDGAKVAVLNTKTGMINFTDGSFVSLK